MQEYLILSVVVAVSLAAHVWLFLWIRFKVDESVIVKCFEDDVSLTEVSIDALAERLDYTFERVLRVCRRSQRLSLCDEKMQVWRLLT